MHQILRPLALLAGLTMVGTLGYVLIEGWPVFDALYMTITTLATVGFMEVHPLSPLGRAFTLVLILFGVGGVLYTLSVMMGYVFEGELAELLGRRRMERRIGGLSDHFILCGYGRVGRQIAADLSREGVRLVVIDADQDSLQPAEVDGHLTVGGDAGQDAVLQRAGVARARALIAAVAHDADNIFITLSARALNPRLMIVARANTDEAVAKLERAGADRVVSPYTMGGRRMAMLALRPLAVEFVDTILHAQGVEFLLEEVEVRPGSDLVGLTLNQVREQRCPGVAILAIKRAESLIPNPPLESAVQVGDELLAMGTRVQLRALESVA